MAKVISCEKTDKFDSERGEYVYNIGIKYVREGYASDAHKIKELLQPKD